MTPGRHDETRAAAALVACAAHGARGRHLQAAVLDGLDPGQCAAIARVLARWLAAVLRETGTDPVEFARSVISTSVEAEAAEDTP